MDQFSPQALQQGNTYTQAVKDRIASLLRMSPGASQAAGMPLMGGMAGQAQQNLQNLPFLRHVQEMQAQGMQPMSQQQFMQQQGMQGQ